MNNLTRREFVVGAAGLGATVAPSLTGLMTFGATARPYGDVRTRSRHRGAGDYGPLRAAGPELALPEGFDYAVLGAEGSLMADGRPTPRAHDGMAAFPMSNGNIRLVRNHEVRDAPGSSRLAGDRRSAYDARAGGGTTSLEIALNGKGRPGVVRDFTSLTGTIYNCAGGPTPWGSWLSCEESTEGVSHGWERPHGYVFEVSASAESSVPTEPLRAMGRFVHEAVAVDPVSGFVYQTEDRQTGGFYRFLPNRPGQLAAGGRLQMLAVQDDPHYITTNGQQVGRALPAVWVEIDNPDPVDAEVNPLAVFAQGYGRGGALFSRLEGCWYGDGSIYFDATNGGNAAAGQIWQYRPIDDERGELTLIFESPSPTVLNRPDNLTVSPRGGLVICEDTEGAFVRGLTPDGRIFDLAHNILNDREFAGACFSPDGRILFFNVQGDTAAGGPGHIGMTFAVWGPWEMGAL